MIPTHKPQGYSSVSPYLIVTDAARTIAFLEEVLGARVTLLMSSSLQIEESVADADVVIGAVLIPGALAPKLVTGAMVAGMKEGSVIADVAIDQGGCFETSRPTTHSEAIADHGLPEAVARDPSLARGVNVLVGKVTYEAVAEAHGLDYARLEDVRPLSPV